jgi:Peptidase family M1 domain
MRERPSRRAAALGIGVLLVVVSSSHPVRGQAPRATPPGPRASPAAPGGQPAPPLHPRVSKRNANYSIDVELDPATRTLQGREVLTWRNVTARPATELQFHLYYNAWANDRSTWMRERNMAPSGRTLRDPRRDDWGWIDVSAIRLLSSAPTPFTDLTAARRFFSPDDGNRDDRTVMSVPLPRAVGPGETIGVEIAWTSKVPRTFSRTGVVGTFYFIAQWFPKIGVLEDTGWNAHQFHAGTEFFSDYGVYDVRVTVPRGWVVGATGREEQRLDTPTGKTTHRYVQEDVHDFAWTTSPDFLERRERFEHPGLPPVEMRLLLQPEHAGQAARHFAATRAALRYYGLWYGPYPYGHITIVDPAWQSGAGGMEYPTLFTAGTDWLAPERSGSPEGVTVHEAGHQFWYGLVGNNEFEHAWLDEGLNTFSTARVLAERPQPDYVTPRFFGGFVPWPLRDVTVSRVDEDGLFSYRTDAESDAQATPSWRYYPATGASITYSKTAVWLHTLERLIGWPRLQRGMSLFFTRHVFTHPTPDDFFRAIEEGAGEDLGWYFDEVSRGSNVVDYGIQRFTSEGAAPRGWVERNGTRTYSSGDNGHDRSDRYVTELVVRRYGEAIMPVDVLVSFADGQRVRERWDGRDRWKLYRWERAARAATAQVDPDRVLLIDVNFTNNTSAIEPDRARAARKWTAIWVVWLQDALLTWASLV